MVFLLVFFLIAKNLTRPFSSQFYIFICYLITSQITDLIVFITYLRTCTNPFIDIKRFFMKQNSLIICTVNLLNSWTLTVSWRQLRRWSNRLTFRHKINRRLQWLWRAFYCARIFDLIFFLCIFFKNSNSQTFLLLLMF